MVDRGLQLPDHILESIAEKLNLDDLYRFSCVCKTWRSIGTALLPPKLHPWLIVNYGDYTPQSGTIRNETLGFFSLYNRKTYKVETPQISNRRICGSCHGGWLITVHENGEIQLLHPFTKAVIDLPPVTTLPSVDSSYINQNGLHYTVESLYSNTREDVKCSCMREFYIYKAIMSSTNGIVMVIEGLSRRLSFCRPGMDNAWRLLGGHNESTFSDLIVYQGEFYAVGLCGDVYVVCDLQSSAVVVELVMRAPYGVWLDKSYLVGCNGGLLMLMRKWYKDWGSDELHLTNAFVVNKLDFSKGKWVPVADIGEHYALFVGCNASFTLSTLDAPGWEGNCIYFTDDCILDFKDTDDQAERLIVGHDLGVYRLGGNVIERFYPRESKLIEPGEDYVTKLYQNDSKLIMPPPVWFTMNSC